MNGEKATVLYHLGRPLARFCFGTFGRMEVTGEENVPPHGPVILACNHLAFTDPPLLVAAIPRPLHFLGKRALFASPIGRLLMRGFHVFPYDRATASTETMRTLLGLLERDRVVALFPEGTRSKNHSLQEAQLGIVYLALKSQAPILPVGVTGTQKTRGWRMPFPMCRLTASIGPPFSLPVIEGRPPRPVMQGMLRMIMERVALQLPPEYRGVYDPTLSPATETQENRGKQCNKHPSSAST
jgi:1-acyl-sn-glycerol-3-phosphate acyltransferase